MIFETHAHYDDEQFDKDREELLDSMEKNGIGTIVNIGSNMETSRWTVKAADKYPFLYGAVGVHPSDTGDFLLMMNGRHLETGAIIILAALMQKLMIMYLNFYSD